MATRGKEPQPSKEKRGTSPSQRKSPSISKQGSPAKLHDTITSERNVPNYLKPTFSSSLDPSKHHVKKASSSDSLNKATISRRRSLEKPLPVSHVQKTRISPNPRERNVRSSSFNSKTTTSQKPLSDRLSKVPKDAIKDHSLHPRPVSGKKSGISEKKQDTEGAAISRKAPTGSPPLKVDAHVDDIPQLELQEDLGSPITEADEELLNAGNKNAIPDEIVVPEDEVHVNTTESILKGDEVHELKMVESSVVPKDQEVATGDKLEEPEDMLQVGEITGNHLQLEEHGEKEKDSSHPEENVEEEPTVEVEKNEVEVAIDDFSGRTLEEKEESGAESTPINSHETESAEDVTKEVKQDTENAETKPEVVQGKKDAAAVSNDVIEETASKLREQRKNKVKALAGAFETVISLQESK